MNRAQVDNIIETTAGYAAAVRRNYEDPGDVNKLAPGVDAPEFERAIRAAYVSGVLSTAQVLAMNDGVHPSKLAEAARIAGEEMTGVKSTPQK